MAVLEIANLTKDYVDDEVVVHALRGVDLKIEKGEFMAIAGPSGSGKTTLLNLIGALDKPTGGSVRLEGRDLGALGRHALSVLRRDRIGFVFQSYNLVPVLTAYENAEIVLALQGVAAATRRAAAQSGLAAPALRSSATILPSISRTTRSACLSTIGSWLENTKVTPCCWLSWRISSTRASPVAWSRLAVGSSASTTAGSAAIARATATRCC